MPVRVNLTTLLSRFDRDGEIRRKECGNDNHRNRFPMPRFWTDGRRLAARPDRAPRTEERADLRHRAGR